jgi:hemerythrin-like domain-containing protein
VNVHPIARVRREHRAVEQDLGRLVRMVAAADRTTPPRTLLTALREFVGTCQRRIGPHFDVEERHIYPHLRDCLPEESAAVDDALREHDTLRELIGLLRLRSDDLRAGAPDSGTDIAETIRDFATLWRAHAHRVDHVVAPLLKTLNEEPHG